jgi:DNA-binding CsgD family transcriptional regulator
LAGFGWSSEEYASFVDIPIQSKFPVTEAIRSNDIIISHKGVDFDREYPLMVEFGYTGPWISGVAIPVYPIGGMALFSSIELELTESLKVFFVAIGSLLGLYASRLPVALVEVAIKVKETIDLPPIKLTDRQVVIAGMLERGFNNAQIGIEIGYSESLIRQESMAIYRKLEVSGRKAMQAIRTLRLENESEIAGVELFGIKTSNS